MIISKKKLNKIIMDARTDAFKETDDRRKWELIWDEISNIKKRLMDIETRNNPVILDDETKELAYHLLYGDDKERITVKYNKTPY